MEEKQAPLSGIPLKKNRKISVNVFIVQLKLRKKFARRPFTWKHMKRGTKALLELSSHLATAVQYLWNSNVTRCRRIRLMGGINESDEKLDRPKILGVWAGCVSIQRYVFVDPSRA